METFTFTWKKKKELYKNLSISKISRNELNTSLGTTFNKPSYLTQNGNFLSIAYKIHEGIFFLSFSFLFPFFLPGKARVTVEKEIVRDRIKKGDYFRVGTKITYLFDS